MPAMNVSVFRQGQDPDATIQKCIEEYGLMMHVRDLWNLVVIEEGMESGAPSVLLWLPTEQGVIIMETSLPAWNGASLLINGMAEHELGYKP